MLHWAETLPQDPGGSVSAHMDTKLAWWYIEEKEFNRTGKNMGYDIDRIEYRDWENEIKELMWSTFLEFEAPLFGKSGTEEFRATIASKAVMEGQTYYGYVKDRVLIGMLATRKEGSHISFLFVRKGSQKLGIGRALIGRALQDCSGDAVTVNAATPAVGFYEKLGFRAQEREQEIGGIRFVPMKRAKSDIITDGEGRQI